MKGNSDKCADYGLKVNSDKCADEGLKGNTVNVQTKVWRVTL